MIEAEVEVILGDGDISFEAIDALRDKATTILRRSLVTCPSGFWLNLLGPGSTSSTEDIVYPIFIVSWLGRVWCRGKGAHKTILKEDNIFYYCSMKGDEEREQIRFLIPRL